MASKDKRLPIEGNIPDLNTEWDDGTYAYNTEQIEAFIKRQLREVKDSVPEVDATLDKNSTHAVANNVVAAALEDAVNSVLADSEVVFRDDAYEVKLMNDRGVRLTSFEIPVQSSPGEGVEGKDIRLSVSVEKSVIKAGDTAVVSYTYDRVYVGGESSGESTNEDARITVEVIRKPVTVMSVTETKAPSGAAPYTVDVSGCLAPGYNDIRVTAVVKDTDTNVVKQKSRTVKVYVSALEFSSDLRFGEMIAGGGLGDSAKIPYRISGAGTKTVYLYIDGTQKASATVNRSSVTNGEFTVDFRGMSPGLHTADMYAEAVIEGATLYSRLVHYDLLVAGGAGLWCGLAYTNDYDGSPLTEGMPLTVDVTQYMPMRISYGAYSPDAERCQVTIYVDGVLKQTVLAGRSEQTYNLLLSEGEGLHTLTIDNGGRRRTLNVNVKRAPVDIGIATGGLVYALDAQGRSNTESDPASWGVGQGIVSEFEGVDWSVSGWTGESLKLVNGARAMVGIRPFAEECGRRGLTLEMLVKVSNATDRVTPIIDCSQMVGESRQGLVVMSDSMRYLTGKTVDYVDEDGNPQVREMGLKTNFRSDGYMLMSLVVTPLTGKQASGLIELYIDGDRVGAETYSSAFEFKLGTASTSPVLTFDSSAADLEIKKIRVYNRGLTDEEVLDNAIAEQTDLDTMLGMYKANDVLSEGTDGDGHRDVSMTALAQQGKGLVRIVRPEMLDDIFECNDKKADYFFGDVYYTPSAEAASQGSKPFVLKGCNIRIQGTSSTKYPTKNIRIYMNKGNYDNGLPYVEIGGETVTQKSGMKYSLRNGTPKQSVFCFKKDYSDSTMSLNTGGAKMFNDTFKRLGLLTPPQRHEYTGGGTTDGNLNLVNVRAAIDGLPVDIFVSPSEQGDAVYVGQYNFNNEKSKSEAIFGMSGVDGFDAACPIALESLNNGVDLCNFICVGDVDAKLDEEFDGAFEFNFPEDTFWGQAKLDKEGKGTLATDAQRTAVRRLIAFIKDCATASGSRVPDADDLSTFTSQYFVDHAHEYFDVDYMLTYYLWTDYFMAVDQRAKNILWRTWDGVIWYPTYYDGDTQMGKCNESYLKYDYNVTRSSEDYEFGRKVFQGYRSWLWNLVLANMPERLRTCAKDLRSAMTTRYVMDMYEDEQMGNWSLRAYNRSGYLSYIKPMIEPVYGHIWPFIYALQGRNLPHRRYMVENRFAVLDAKYGCGDFSSDIVPLSLAQQSGETSYIRLEMSEDYCTGYGTNNNRYEYLSDVVPANEPVELAISGQRDGTDPMRIYGASRITRFDASGVGGHLSNKIEFTRCSVLQELDLSAPVGQASISFAFTVDGCRRVTRINLNGQTNACTGDVGSKELNFQDQGRLQWLDCRGVDAHAVTLAKGAPLEEYYTPDTMRSLELKDMAVLSDGGLHVTNYAQLRSVAIENCPSLDVPGIVSRWLSDKVTADEDCSLTLKGIRWSGVSVEFLLRIASLGRTDLEGVMELTEAPTSEQARVLVAAFGRSCFGGNGRLTITVPGCSFLIAAPDAVFEGVTAENALEVAVIAVTPGMADVAISVECDDSVSYRIEGATVYLWSQETGATRSVTIRASGVFEGITLRSSAEMTVRAKIYPTSFSLSAATTMNSGNTLAVSLTHVAVAGDCGEWTVDWSLSGDLADDDNVYIQSSTREGCSIAAQAECPIGTVTVTATVRKGNSALLATVTKDITVLSADVIASVSTNPILLQIAKSKNWTDNDYLTAGQAAAVTDSTFGTATFHQSSISSFDEFAYFNGLRTLPAATFRETSALRELTLPEGLTAIGAYGLWDNKALEILTFPSTLTNVGNQDVNLNHKLHTVYFTGAVPSGSINWANNGVQATHDKVIYVPAGLGAAYRSAWTSLGGWTITEII